MSKPFLQKLLQEQIDQITKDGESFRKDNELAVHKLTVSLQGLRNQVWADLKEKGIIDKDGVEKETYEKLKLVIDNYTKNITDTIWRKAHQDKKNDKLSGHIDIVGNRANFHIVTSIRKYGWTRQAGGNWALGDRSVFETIRDSYRSQRRTLVRNINKVLKEVGVEKQATSLIQLGHRENSSIVKQRITENKEQIVKKLENENINYNKFLKDFGIKLEISKKDSKDKTIIEVSMESQEINEAKGRGKERQLKEKYIDILQKAINKLESDPGEWEGSDSRRQIEEKKALAAFQDNIKTSKNLRLTEKADTKLKLSKGKSESKKIKQKSKKGNKRAVSLNLIGIKSGVQKSSAESTIALAALINQKLPQTVMANMKPPALQNRTGRFAQSVKVTDVMQTQKGYPSIGYTYRKNPYQTFEMGQKQGSKDRDPRTLIDRSIREIAAELLVGRFFTRRN